MNQAITWGAADPPFPGAAGFSAWSQQAGTTAPFTNDPVRWRYIQILWQQWQNKSEAQKRALINAP
jgi:hypothetical protein